MGLSAVTFVFLPFPPLLSLHVEYLSLMHLRILTPPSGLVKARQSKPIFLFPSAFVLSFPPDYLMTISEYLSATPRCERQKTSSQTRLIGEPVEVEGSIQPKHRSKT
jgi:hypothetical protein